MSVRLGLMMPLAVAAVGLAAAWLIDQPLASVLAAAVAAAALLGLAAGAVLSRLAPTADAATEPDTGATAAVQQLIAQLPLATLVFRGDQLVDANPAARVLLRADDDPSALSRIDDHGLRTAITQAGDGHGPIDVELEHQDRQLQARVVGLDDRVVVVLTDATASRRVEAMRRDFVTNASHELKTPAAGMQALAESIAVAIDRDPPRARQMIDRLQHEAARLSTMVRDLLDLARLEDDRSGITQRVDLAATAAQQLARFDDLVCKRRLTVDDSALQPAVVIAPPEDVRLVVANLIENAVRYNHPDGQLAVATATTGDHAVLEVTDTGIGIAQTDQPRIFERFYRVDKARSRAAGGTGLGLALVRHAVHRNGGRIIVRSTLGEGSTFRVTLPAAHASEASPTRSPVTK